MHEIMFINIYVLASQLVMISYKCVRPEFSKYMIS